MTYALRFLYNYVFAILHHINSNEIPPLQLAPPLASCTTEYGSDKLLLQDIQIVCDNDIVIVYATHRQTDRHDNIIVWLHLFTIHIV